MFSSKFKLLSALCLVGISLFIGCQLEEKGSKPQTSESLYNRVHGILKDSVLLLAEENVLRSPQTVTAFISPRSAGGKHDYFSEGDYWWPDPENPEGPYMRKDGKSNPDNFNYHRMALISFGEIVGNLTSAYLITEDKRYLDAALKHCRAWFIDDSTKMNPNFLYAQAIQGRYTGRGIGIIDAIHFMEIAQSLSILEKQGQIDAETLDGAKTWFNDFLNWLTQHPYGLKEKIHPNNHGSWYNAQVAMFAKFVANDSIRADCKSNFLQNLLPNQMDEDGSFPLEQERTKPYSYSLFNLDAMLMNAFLLAEPQEAIWGHEANISPNIYQGLKYMRPYVEDKKTWPLGPDLMYWEEWPVAHISFLLGAAIFEKEEYFQLWARNKHFLENEVDEVRRTIPIKNPLLWISKE
ncbi:MAG: alginate lyase family protein [Bacteroidia bacterium]|nr:alginate lyase family protein [Bacteroidia bacterium]